MAKLQHTFVQGKMNKDLDERLVPNGQYRDAQNIQVSSSEGSDVGAVENILGNAKQNNKPGGGSWNTSFGLTNAKCIGAARDSQNEKIYWFLTSNTVDAILEYDQTTDVISPVLVDANNVLNFNTSNLITGVNLLDGILFFTDDLSEPKAINVSTFKAGSVQSGNVLATHTQVYGRDFIESDTTAIKPSPKQAISVSSLPSLVTTPANQATGITPIFISVNLGLAPPLVGSKNVGSSFTIADGGFSNAISPQSVFLNKQVTFKTQVFRENGSIIYYEVVCTVTALTRNNEPPAGYFNGGTFRIDTISTNIPNTPLTWEVLLLESDPIFQNDFPRFSYRYKFADNQYSTYAPFSEVAYVPGKFSYEAQNAFNSGMTNNLRKAVLNFPSAAYALPPADVTEIQILYKGHNSNNIYVIENHLIASGTLTTFEVTSELLGPVVESLQLLRPFDALPRKAKSQEIIGNRVVYGNYLHNYTLGGLPTLTGGQTNNSFAVGEELLGQKTIKSDRTYQLGVTFIDAYNRETPIFTDKSASVNVAKDKSLNKNALTASTALSSVPSWADYYKYYIKDSSAGYYNLVLDRWYDDSDGNVWLSLPSEERNKIGSSEFLILKKQHGSDQAVTSNNYYKIIDTQNEAPRNIKFIQTEQSTAAIEVISNGFTSTGPWIGFKGPTFSENNAFHEGFSGTSAIQFSEVAAPYRSTQLYEINQGGPQDDSGGKTNYSVLFDSGVGITAEDTWLTSVSTGTGKVRATIYDLEESNSPEFQGRFFVKVPKGATWERDVEIPSSVTLSKSGFNINVTAGSRSGSVSNSVPSNPVSYIDRLSFGDTLESIPVDLPTSGTTFTLVLGPLSANWTSGNLNTQNSRVYSYLQDEGVAKVRFGNADGSFTEVYNILSVSAEGNYTRNGLDFVYRTFTVDRTFLGELGSTTIDTIEVVTNSESESSATPNPAIFETVPLETADLDIFYEASNALPIAGLSNTVSLGYFNSYSFGNGVESDRVDDDFNAPVIGKGVRVSSTLDKPYKEERKASGLIFSGIFNSTSGVNNTNQFTAAENITKDLNPTYGSIQKLHARDTDLIALLEDKCFRILADKDALFNADGSTNVTSNINVLGQAVPYVGEFGISKNPESFASYGFRTYFTDKARGAVIRLSRDGITEISSKGMTDYFEDGLKSATSDLIGSYDEQNSSYNVKIGPEQVSFKETVDGWATRLSYAPEFAISLNNDYYSFKNGEIWEHSNTTRSNFYGIQRETTVKPVFNDAPTSVKNFKTLSYEGDEGWTATVVTNKQSGSVSTWKDREGIYFNYIMGDATTLSSIDAKEFSVQGIGNVLTYNEPLNTINIDGKINVSLQPGDAIYSTEPSGLRLINTVFSIDRSNNSIRLSGPSPAPIPNPTDFMLFTKDSQVNTSGLLGYYADIEFSVTSGDKKELFAVNSEIFISSE
jgi:hypothetical protein